MHLIKMVIPKLILNIVFIGCILNCCQQTEGRSDDLRTSNQSRNLTVCEKRQKKIASVSPAAGYIGAFVAIFMFGSNFIPVKKIQTGDGIFFQWIVCIGIWTCGLFVHIYNGHERQFYPLVMVGGAIWCTGNMCVVPVIKTIGLAMGLLIWGILNLLAGWATGRFGTFGLICKQPVTHSALNFVGVLLAMISLGIFILIKSEDSSENVDSMQTIFNNDRREISVQDEGSRDEENVYLLDDMPTNNDSSWVDNLTKKQKRLIGILLSVVSGIFYGVSFVPLYIVQKNDADAPDDGIQYTFSQYCGTLLASTVYFLIYCLYKRNKPDLYPEAAAPGFISGILWGIGNVGWFVANTYLSEAISFPIVTTGPGIIASIWGIFIFKEITGKKNFILLGIAICFAVSGAAVTGISK